MLGIDDGLFVAIFRIIARRLAKRRQKLSTIRILSIRYIVAAQLVASARENVLPNTLEEQQYRNATEALATTVTKKDVVWPNCRHGELIGSIASNAMEDVSMSSRWDIGRTWERENETQFLTILSIVERQRRPRRHWRIDPAFKVEAFTCPVIRCLIKCKGCPACVAT